MFAQAPRPLRWLLGLFATLGLVGVALFAAGAVYAFDPLGGRDVLPFEARTWRASPPVARATSPRLRMVPDLVASGVLLELGPSEVEGLLGPPTERSSVLWDFFVGPEPWGGDPFRAAYLSVRFDEDGRVAECFLRGT